MAFTLKLVFVVFDLRLYYGLAYSYLFSCFGLATLIYLAPLIHHHHHHHIIIIIIIIIICLFLLRTSLILSIIFFIYFFNQQTCK